jgi:replicative DNA helicase
MNRPPVRFTRTMDTKLTPFMEILERADLRLRSDEPEACFWPTGFGLLDDAIGGGLRAGSLSLLAGPQGEGKSTFALQIARNAVVAGRSAIYFSYELEAEQLLQKLVAMEAGEMDDLDAPNLSQIRAVFEGTGGGDGGLVDRIQTLPNGVQALLQVHSYAERFVAYRSTAIHTTIDVIASAIKEVAVRTGQVPLVVVDYLQKVCEPEGNDENEKITRITERLKDLSIEFGCPVLAVAAADREGLEPGSRMRARHMRGSTALAYEPDLVLVLNTKSDIVARHHLVYDGEAASRFRDWSVLTIEKNRSGHDGAELEFRKRFEQGRFDTVGKAVSETLVDERVFTE